MTITVRWLDDTIQTYKNVIAKSVDEDGAQLTLSVAGAPPRGQAAIKHIPLANVRWWGETGAEYGW